MSGPDAAAGHLTLENRIWLLRAIAPEDVAGKLHYRQGLAVPITVRLPSGGGFSGGPFHSQNPEAWFMHAPGIKVVAPSSAEDAKGLLHAAIHDANPVCFMEHKHLYRRIKGEVPDGVLETPMTACRRTRRSARSRRTRSTPRFRCPSPVW